MHGGYGIRKLLEEEGAETFAEKSFSFHEASASLTASPQRVTRMDTASTQVR
jgi:hypothetical protein